MACSPHGLCESSAQYARPGAVDQPMAGDGPRAGVGPMTAIDPTIDPRDARFFTAPDYHHVLARLRAEAPVREWSPGFWTVARYEQIRDLSRNPEQFCSGRGALVNDPLRGGNNPMSTPSILHMDPP